MKFYLTFIKAIKKKSNLYFIFYCTLIYLKYYKKEFFKFSNKKMITYKMLNHKLFDNFLLFSLSNDFF